MNSDKRMAELYLERAAGKKHLIEVRDGWEDRPLPTAPFRTNLEYKLKPETLDDLTTEICVSYGIIQSNEIRLAIRVAAQWAWANPESKE